MRGLVSRVIVGCAALCCVVLPAQTTDVGAGWYPGKLAQRVVANRVAAREARGAVVLLPRVAAAYGRAPHGNAGSCGDCGTPEARAGQALADARNLQRRQTGLSYAAGLDSLAGHRAGRGPFARAMKASTSQQNRIVQEFNATIGAEHDFRAGSVADILRWLVDHKQEIFDVLKLIIEIIGLF